MTHLQNYGNDRLGIYTFDKVFRLFYLATTFDMKTLPPAEMAYRYFKKYPDERLPIWMNPCDDKRHLEIWSTEKDCKHLPSLLVVGPQKTGECSVCVLLYTMYAGMWTDTYYIPQFLFSRWVVTLLVAFL